MRDKRKKDIKEKRVLFIHHGSGIGGAPKSLSYLTESLKNIGFKVEVLFLFNSDAVSLFSKDNVSIVSIPLPYFHHHSKWIKIYRIDLIFIQFVSWIISAFLVAPFWFIKLKPEVIYLNSSSLTAWSFAGKLMNIPTVIHVRESVSEGHLGVRQKIISRLINYSGSKIIFLSKQNYKKLNTSPSKSFIIANYVKTKTKAIKKQEKRYDFIYIGGDVKIKGIEFVKNFILSDLGECNICLLGYYNDDFKQEFGSLNNVNILGVVDDALSYIAASKFLFFPAITPHFPRPVIEALSVGTIPIVSDLEGIEEIVIDNFSGFVFDINKIKSFNQTVSLAKQCNYDKTVNNGFEVAKNNFSIQNEKKIIRIISSCIK